MTEQEIKRLIQDRIDEAVSNKEKAEASSLQAKNDGERENARLLSQISTAQRLLLQGILSEIQEKEESERTTAREDPAMGTASLSPEWRSEMRRREVELRIIRGIYQVFFEFDGDVGKHLEKLDRAENYAVYPLLEEILTQAEEMVNARLKQLSVKTRQASPTA